jgi:hypothetical protein
MTHAVHIKELMLDEETPLKWPDGWERTPIQDRKAQPGWKRPLLRWSPEDKLACVQAFIERTAS